MARFRSAALALFAAATVATLLIEVAARHIFDFPLYDADDEVGYWLKPNQSGTFMLNKDWHFNADSLGVAEPFAPGPKADVLLVGDSLVFGGNELDQRDKLGPILERRTGAQVWPMAAGSWGIANELAFLRRKPHLLAGTDVLVWVVNSQDFGPPSVWTSEVIHPRRRPSLYLAYVAAKVKARYLPQPAAPVPPMSADTLFQWTAFAKGAKKPLIVIAYNTLSEAGSKCAWAPEQFRQFGRWYCYDVTHKRGANLFRDGIHPTAKGNQSLATFIASALADTARQEPIAGYGLEPERASRR